MTCFFGHKWTKYGDPYTKQYRLADAWKGVVIPNSEHYESYQNRKCERCGLIQRQKVDTVC